MKRIAIINGPNLNLLGKREPEVYGSVGFDAFMDKLRSAHPDVSFSYFQSNVEGELIDQIQKEGFGSDGIILNPGGYTHTSVAIGDAIAAIKAPVVEVHISNVAARESFRHESLLTPVCRGLIMGFGFESYALALRFFEP